MKTQCFVSFKKRREKCLADDQKMLETKTPDVLSLYRGYKAVLESYGRQNENEKQVVSVEEIVKTLNTNHSDD